MKAVMYMFSTTALKSEVAGLNGATRISGSQLILTSSSFKSYLNVFPQGVLATIVTFAYTFGHVGINPIIEMRVA